MQAQILKVSAGEVIPTRAKYVMTDAVEGSGIAYWAEVKDVKRGAGNYVVSFKVRDAGNEGRRVSAKWTTVNAVAVESAAERLREMDICSRDIAAQFCGVAWDTDQNGVDCIVQVIAFGKLIFG